jgi:putative transposase
VIAINGVKHWLWRAVDANGDMLDILVQGRRNAKAAKRFISRLMAQFGHPSVAITDKLRSYIKPISHQGPDADHRAHKGLNNRIEGSHRPTRRREKIMGRFKSPRQAQRFLAAHDQINNILRPCRCRPSAGIVT